MIGGNHATFDTAGENFKLHCESIYYSHDALSSIDRSKYVGTGRLINFSSIDTSARLLKLEMSAQMPMKSPFKLKCDTIKNVKR